MFGRAGTLGRVLGWLPALAFACRVVTEAPLGDAGGGGGTAPIEAPAEDGSGGARGMHGEHDEPSPPNSAGKKANAPGDGGETGGDPSAGGGSLQGDGGDGARSGNSAGGAGSGGESGASGAAGAVDDAPCILGESCPLQCESAKAKCTVVPKDFACEFEIGAGLSAQVACGETALIKEVCCGGCGCTALKVYFDGADCWQGVPDCPLPDFAGKLLKATN